ncbi:MAG: hypothetical protein HKM04_02005 [Legionellales bacterium]|nr:hypothetical protein [Legionellales bacterium]
MPVNFDTAYAQVKNEISLLTQELTFSESVNQHALVIMSNLGIINTPNQTPKQKIKSAESKAEFLNEANFKWLMQALTELQTSKNEDELKLSLTLKTVLSTFFPEKFVEAPVNNEAVDFDAAYHKVKNLILMLSSDISLSDVVKQQAVLILSNLGLGNAESKAEFLKEDNFKYLMEALDALKASEDENDQKLYSALNTVLQTFFPNKFANKVLVNAPVLPAPVPVAKQKAPVVLQAMFSPNNNNNNNNNNVNVNADNSSQFGQLNYNEKRKALIQLLAKHQDSLNQYMKIVHANMSSNGPGTPGLRCAHSLPKNLTDAINALAANQTFYEPTVTEHGISNIHSLPNEPMSAISILARDILREYFATLLECNLGLSEHTNPEKRNANSRKYLPLYRELITFGSELSDLFGKSLKPYDDRTPQNPQGFKSLFEHDAKFQLAVGGGPDAELAIRFNSKAERDQFLNKIGVPLSDRKALLNKYGVMILDGAGNEQKSIYIRRNGVDTIEPNACVNRILDNLQLGIKHNVAYNANKEQWELPAKLVRWNAYAEKAFNGELAIRFSSNEERNLFMSKVFSSTASCPFKRDNVRIYSTGIGREDISIYINPKAGSSYELAGAADQIIQALANAKHGNDYLISNSIKFNGDNTVELKQAAPVSQAGPAVF